MLEILSVVYHGVMLILMDYGVRGIFYNLIENQKKGE